MNAFMPVPVTIGWQCPCSGQCGGPAFLEQYPIKRHVGTETMPDGRVITFYLCNAGCRWQYIWSPDEPPGSGTWHYLGRREPPP